MSLRPAEPNTGIVFRRIDRHNGAREVPATHDRVVDNMLCTTIGQGDVRVRTIEHLMAAFAGCAVDNAIVELDGEEVPIMDGSAAPFVFLIECAGTVEQAAARRAIEVIKPISIGDDQRTISIRPADRFSIRCEIEFGDSTVGAQAVTYDPARSSFRLELARARTFCFEADVKQMQAAGFGLGGSLENAVVVGQNGVLNEDGLRYPDEFVRHKALDCLGDLYLSGAPILGHVHSVRAGHKMNHALLDALLADRSAWRMITLDGTRLEEREEPFAAIA